jgi:mRNA interferase MazF
MMEKDFDNWNEQKKRIEFATDLPPLFPQEREVRMCSLGRNVGFEQNGTGSSFGRPVLVIKKFNNQMFWVVPLSTKQKAFDFYHNFVDPNGQKVAVVLAQPRLLSVKRFERNIYTISLPEFDSISAKLIGFLTKSKPRTRRGFSEPEGTL